MTTVPFSLSLDAATKARLDEEARGADRTAAELAAVAIELFLDARAARRKAIDEAVIEADKGVFVSQDAVARWMESWDDEAEPRLPEPDVFPNAP
jgi:predicted transcriptional regulator